MYEHELTITVCSFNFKSASVIVIDRGAQPILPSWILKQEWLWHLLDSDIHMSGWYGECLSQKPLQELFHMLFSVWPYAFVLAQVLCQLLYCVCFVLINLSVYFLLCLHSLWEVLTVASCILEQYVSQFPILVIFFYYYFITLFIYDDQLPLFDVACMEPPDNSWT